MSTLFTFFFKKKKENNLLIIEKKHSSSSWEVKYTSIRTSPTIIRLEHLTNPSKQTPLLIKGSTEISLLQNIKLQKDTIKRCPNLERNKNRKYQFNKNTIKTEWKKPALVSDQVKIRSNQQTINPTTIILELNIKQLVREFHQKEMVKQKFGLL